MCFNPEQDRHNWYTRLMFVQHFACLAPVYGRDTGTGNPGFTFFNRGGGPLSVDPLNKNDRTQNAHLLLFGPTGAGKSATALDKLAQMIAIYRSRIFLLEAGNSFGLPETTLSPWDSPFIVSASSPVRPSRWRRSVIRIC